MVMVKRNGAALQVPEEEDEMRMDALAYWYLQEQTPLPPLEPPLFEGLSARSSNMTSGWWILPVLVLSAAAWGAIIIALL